jgi:uncharacterized membrane protein SpoIIM required for sporulation
MVLESILSPTKAERKPFELFFLGIIYASIGALLAWWIFKEWSSMVMVFLTAMASIPLMYRTLKYEEHEDMEIKDEYPLIKQHMKAVLFFIFLFLGFTIAFSFWNFILPAKTVAIAFKAQASTINLINNPTGAATSINIFMKIFSNNIRVLFFCIFFSFFYGAGAIFILAWNGSVIGTAIGALSRNKLGEIMAKVGFVHAGNYFQVLTLGILRYLPHGIIEVIGFFIGGLAGGIISVAVVNHDFGSKEFNHILADSLDLLIMAILIIFFAAIVEVYFTPSFFHLVSG